jgi:hypothetical protein
MYSVRNRGNNGAISESSGRVRGKGSGGAPGVGFCGETIAFAGEAGGIETGGPCTAEEQIAPGAAEPMVVRVVEPPAGFSAVIAKGRP